MPLAAPSARTHFNLAGASVLLVEGSHHGMGVLSQIFIGFGVSDAHRARDAAEALEAIRSKALDLIVTETSLPGMDGYDLVREIRRAKGNPNCFAPVILVSGHIQPSKVRTARDCGANFIVAKPLTPRVLLDRIVWISQEHRPFVDVGHYVGPDRRFQPANLPQGRKERRKGEDEAADTAASVDEARSA